MGLLSVLQSQGGTVTVAVGLTVIIVWLFRTLTVERKGRSEDTARWRAELARVNADHDQEIAEMRAKIKRLETREEEVTARLQAEIERLNTRLDNEMERRRALEYGNGGAA